MSFGLSIPIVVKLESNSALGLSKASIAYNVQSTSKWHVQNEPFLTCLFSCIPSFQSANKQSTTHYCIQPRYLRCLSCDYGLVIIALSIKPIL